MSEDCKCLKQFRLDGSNILTGVVTDRGLLRRSGTKVQGEQDPGRFRFRGCNRAVNETAECVRLWKLNS